MAKAIVHPFGQIVPAIGLYELEVVEVDYRARRSVNLELVIPDHLTAEIEE